LKHPENVAVVPLFCVFCDISTLCVSNRTSYESMVGYENTICAKGGKKKHYIHIIWMRKSSQKFWVTTGRGILILVTMSDAMNPVHMKEM
jgi:hypothetical protein